MKDSILEEQQKLNLSRFSNLIRSIWLLTSEFPINDSEMENRAFEWSKVLGADFFEKWEKYVLYLIQRCSQFREWRGPVHCDEFYRMFCKVCIERQVYSFKRSEWIPEMEAIESILNSNESLGEVYRSVVDVAVPNGKCIDVRLRDEVFEKCRAVIYGWEE